jgi:hypothetical protein
MAASVYSVHCSTGRRAMKPFSSFLLDSQILTYGCLPPSRTATISTFGLLRIATPEKFIPK